MEEAVTKDHMLCDSMLMRPSEQADRQRRKVDYWLPRDEGGRGRGVTANEAGASFDENILKLDCENDHKSLNMLKVSGLYALKG